MAMKIRSSRYRLVGLMQIEYLAVSVSSFGWEGFDCQPTLAAQTAAELIRLTDSARAGRDEPRAGHSDDLERGQ